MVKTSGRSDTSSRSSRKTPTATKPGNGNSKPDYTRHILCTLLLRLPLVMLNMSGIATLLLALSLAAHVAQALPLPSTTPSCHDSSTSTTTCYQVAHTSNGPSSSQLELQQLPVAFTGVDVLTRSSSPASLSDALLLAATPRSMLPTALATDATVTLSSEIEANRTANANGTAANGTATAGGGDGGGDGEQHESWLKKAITTVKGWFSRRGSSGDELTRYIAREAAGGGINEGGGTLDEIIERVLNAFLDHIDEADGGLNLTTGTATTSTSSTEIKPQHLQQHWQRRAGQVDVQDEHKRESGSPWDRWKIDDKQDGPVPWGNWKLGGRDSDDTGVGSLSSMLLAQRHEAGGAIERDEVLGSRSSSSNSEGQHNAEAKTVGDDTDRLRFVSFVPHIPAAGSSSAKAW